MLPPVNLPVSGPRYRLPGGLSRATVDTVRARQRERLWRVPVFLALAATIPAFYADLLGASGAWWVVAVYSLAAITVAASLAHVAYGALSPGNHLRANWIDLLLVAGLLGSAATPGGADAQLALGFRLAVAFLTMLRMAWIVQPLVRRGGTLYLLALSMLVLLMCGVGFWWLEPRTPTLPDGLWLAFTTAATVGYGDVVPTTPASKIFSVFVVLLGYGVLTLVTAAIATSWIETEERRLEREILDGLRAQVANVHADLAAVRAELHAAARLLAQSREEQAITPVARGRFDLKHATDQADAVGVPAPPAD